MSLKIHNPITAQCANNKPSSNRNCIMKYTPEILYLLSNRYKVGSNEINSIVMILHCIMYTFDY